MKHYKIKVLIEVEVSSEYNNIEDVIDEFGAETDYSLPSTENVEVRNTEILEIL
jgi:hypothetical protein